MTATGVEIANALADGTSTANVTASGSLTGWTADNGTDTAIVVFTSTSVNTNVTDLGNATFTGTGAPSAIAPSPYNQGVAGKIANVGAFLVGKTACATDTQEEHRGSATGGQLWDYKMGPGHATDPTAQEGTWSASADVVTYNYSGGSNYSYNVYDLENGNYEFCTNGTSTLILTATLPATNGTTDVCP
jgi:hypothetical protein